MSSGLVQVDGWMRPAPHQTLTPEGAAELLRAVGVPGAVGSADSRGVLPLALIADPGTPTKLPGTGRLLVDALGEAAQTHGVAFQLGNATWIGEGLPADAASPGPSGPPGPPGPPTPGPPDVLLARLDTDLLPVLAHHVGSPLVWEPLDDDFVLVRCEQRGAQLHAEGFTRGELPVIALSTIAGHRYCSVLVNRGVLPGHTLTTQAPWVPTFDATVTHAGLLAALPALGELHRTPEETLRALVGSRHLPAVDEDALRAALAGPADEEWSARVLKALGLPRLPADVHEGRVALHGSRVEPRGAWGTVRDLARGAWRRRRDRDGD